MELYTARSIIIQRRGLGGLLACLFFVSLDLWPSVEGARLLLLSRTLGRNLWTRLRLSRQKPRPCLK